MLASLLITLASAEVPASRGPLVAVTGTEVLSHYEPVLAYEGTIAPEDLVQGMLIPKMYEQLSEMAIVAEYVAARNPLWPFGGEIRILAEPDTPWSVMRPVLYTVDASGFRDVRLVTSREPDAAFLSVSVSTRPSGEGPSLVPDAGAVWGEILEQVEAAQVGGEPLLLVLRPI